MASSIRPNRTEINRTFPWLGFTVRTGVAPAWFEVAIATDTNLLAPDARPRRTPENFYSTRAAGPLPAPSGEAVWIVPQAVLARFAGQPQLFYALATFRSPDRQGAEITQLIGAAAPAVVISRSFTGSTRRLAGVGGRGTPAPSGYASGTGDVSLDWAGDAPQAGVAAPAVPARNGHATTNGGPAAKPAAGEPVSPAGLEFEYDDGLGAFPPPPSLPPLALSAIDVSYGDVELVPQPSGVSCWAAAAAMVVGWRDRVSIDPAQIAARSGYWERFSGPIGLSPSNHDEFGHAWGLQVEPPMDYAVDGFGALLANNGPLWVARVPTGNPRTSGHAVCVVALRGDGTPDGTQVTFHDPWPVDQGAAAQSISYATFMREFDNYVTKDPEGRVNILILHANGRRPVSALSLGATDVRYDDVQLVAQQDGITCWAAAAAMVVGWRDRMSIDPSEIARQAGPWVNVVANGLLATDNDEFARAWGLRLEPPQTYTVDGLRALLERAGPLWVDLHPTGNAPNQGHVVCVTGLTGDGTPDGTIVRFHDPWPPNAGRAHSTTTFRQLMTDIGDFADTDGAGRVNNQILHAGGRGGGAAAQAFEAIDVFYDEVELVPQPTGVSCWAAAGAMLVGWRDRVSINPAEIASQSGYWARFNERGLSTNDNDEFAAAWGLEVEPPQDYSVEGYARLLQSMGPLWVGRRPTGNAPGSGHAVCVIGLRGDGTPDGTHVHFHDPWPPNVGRANRALTYAQFTQEYDDFVTVDPSGRVNNQIMHSGGRRAGDTALSLGARSSGQAVVEIASAVAGAVMTRVLDNSGDVRWELEQMRGGKSPPGVDGFTQPVRTIPFVVAGPRPVATVYGLDEIYADFHVTFQCDGRTVGNVQISPQRTNDAAGAGLDVRANIMDDANLYVEPGSDVRFAALKILFTYRWDFTMQDDTLARAEVMLYGNGEHPVRYEVVQA